MVTVNRMLTLGGLGGTSKPWAGAPDLVIVGPLKPSSGGTGGPTGPVVPFAVK